MGIHTFLPHSAMSFHNNWLPDMAEVEALPCSGKLYKFRWSAGRRLFLIKGQKRINIDRGKIPRQTKRRCGETLEICRCYKRI